MIGELRMLSHITTLIKSINFNNNISIEEICIIFNTTNIEDAIYYLKKYEQLNFIKIKEKDGVYSISNHKNIEENLIKYIEHNIEFISYEEWVSLLELNWSESTLNKFIALFRLKYPDDDFHVTTFYEPYPLKVQSINPLEAVDVYSYKLLSSIYDQLFVYDKGIKKNLVQHYTMDDHVLKIYLKKHVKFHDNSILCADDVVNNLNLLFKLPSYAFYSSNILSIERLTQYSLQIIMKQSTPMILNILSTVQSSIFKQKGDQYIGTGPYYLGHDYISHRELNAFDDYHHGRPYIDKVINLQVPIDFYRDSKYQSFIEGTTMKTVEEVYSLVMLLFNTRREQIKNPKIRAYVSDIIHYHLNYILNLDDNLFPNYHGFFNDSQLKAYNIPEKNVFQNHDISIAIIDNFESIGETIAALLESYGFNVIRTYYQFSEFKKTDINSINADLTVLLYGFYSDADYAFYGFLTTIAAPLLKGYPKLTQLLNDFNNASIDELHSINLKIEKILIEQNIIVPILKNKRKITVPNNIIDYKIDCNGFIDYRSIIL